MTYGQKPGEYPKYQRKYVIRTGVLGGFLVLLLLFQLLVWPGFKVLCATYYWGTPLLICHELLPFLGAFAAGGLIPSALQLFVPIHLEKRTSAWCRIGAIAALLPFILFCLGILPLGRWILHRVVYAVLTYVLPFVSGICLMLGATSEHL